MANKSVFASMRGRLLPKATATNAAGAPAYAYDAEHKLAQMAMTGTIGQSFYVAPERELASVLRLAAMVEAEFLAQTAVHARAKGHMKDMPAILLAVLAGRDPVLFRRVFHRVVDNGRMLRTFVQVMRSGQTGRKSLGSRPKAMVAEWLNEASDWAILQANIGNDPSLADVIRMVHPKPASPAREALFAWIIGRPCDVGLLPQAVQDWLAFKATGKGPVPDVPFQMLTQLPLSQRHWTKIAERGSWQMVRMNLNTFQRHGVFEREKTVRQIAGMLRDPKRIEKARVFPYQLMVAATSASADLPGEIRSALHDAMEQAVANVPQFAGSVAVCPDVSGSMHWPVTGWRPGAGSKVRCVDVAALVAAAVMRRNPEAEVLPFENRVVDVRLEPRDTIQTNAERLAGIGGGGTNCSAPLAKLAARGQAPDLVIIVSDNQSWVDARAGRGTGVMVEWETLKQRNPKAKLVCIDIAPYGTTQAKERDDVLNVGGFSDAVFEQIARFAAGEMGPAHWVGEIEKVRL
ncbi:MAG: TROVE domain-containing protein [Pseudomonadota bacterium]